MIFFYFSVKSSLCFPLSYALPLRSPRFIMIICRCSGNRSALPLAVPVQALSAAGFIIPDSPGIPSHIPHGAPVAFMRCRCFLCSVPLWRRGSVPVAPPSCPAARAGLILTYTVMCMPYLYRVMLMLLTFLQLCLLPVWLLCRILPAVPSPIAPAQFHVTAGGVFFTIHRQKDLFSVLPYDSLLVKSSLCFLTDDCIYSVLPAGCYNPLLQPWH